MWGTPGWRLAFPLPAARSLTAAGLYPSIPSMGRQRSLLRVGMSQCEGVRETPGRLVWRLPPRLTETL